MTQTFRMDKPQPRLLDETRQGVIGTPMDRPDGPLKVSGQATYTADALPEGCVHGMLVRATVTRGHLRDIDRDSIADIPGLLAVVRDPRFLRNPAQGMAGEATASTITASRWRWWWPKPSRRRATGRCG